eukprot:scaffold113004_cov32-Tisochrysis_lutea.AAC.3
MGSAIVEVHRRRITTPNSGRMRRDSRLNTAARSSQSAAAASARACTNPAKCALEIVGVPCGNGGPVPVAASLAVLSLWARATASASGNARARL